MRVEYERLPVAVAASVSPQALLGAPQAQSIGGAFSRPAQSSAQPSNSQRRSLCLRQRQRFLNAGLLLGVVLCLLGSECV